MTLTKEFLFSLVEESKAEIPDKALEDTIKKQEDSSLRSPGVEAHYYRYFYRLYQRIKPKLTIELGTSYGHSSMCMAKGNPDGIVMTVNNLQELWDECRCDNVRYLHHDSLISINPSLPVDVLFIDTWHDGVRCKLEWDLYNSHVAEDGIVFIDDIHLFPCMKEFWNSFNPEGWIKFEMPIHGAAGMGVLIREPKRV